jgi:hypothetical protein
VDREFDEPLTRRGKVRRVFKRLKTIESCLHAQSRASDRQLCRVVLRTIADKPGAHPGGSK